MKLLIASDIHGSAFYCEQLLKAYQKEDAERVLLLGDLLYHGPRNELPKGYAPKEVIRLLNEQKETLLCVRGNCEAEVDQMVLDFPVMADFCLLHLDGCTIYATHGHLWNEVTPPPLKKGDILLCGHTHIPKYAACGKAWYLNPGSVSIPKEGSANSYLIFEDGVFTWKNLAGEVYMQHRIVCGK